MTSSLPRLALVFVLFTAAALAQPNEIRKSIARINNTAQEANYRAPCCPAG